MIRELPLYVYPPSVVYSGNQFDALKDAVRAEQLTTQIVDLYSARQLFLLENAVTDEGFRYTAQAFMQVCKLAAPGLSRLLADLSGTIPRPTDSIYDAQLAIKTFNAVINTRFRCIERYMAVLDNQKKYIIGFVPMRNFYLDNCSWFERIHESIQNYATPFRFAGARATGRTISLWYRAEKAALKANVKGQQLPLYAGVYFCNGESIGKSIRGAKTCFSSIGQFLGNFKDHGGSVKHSALMFESEFDQLLDYIANVDLPLAELGSALHAAAGRKLVTTFSTVKSIRQVKRRLVAFLTENNVASYVAKRAVDRALYGDESGELIDENFYQALDKKTWFDVVSSVLKDAKTFSFSRRERIEQAIFDFLLNFEGEDDA